MVMADDNCTVRVAEDNLCSHIYQLVHKKQAAFEHLLMNKYAAFSLSGDNEHHTQQVRRQSGPGSVGDGHDGTVDKRLYLIRFLCGHVDIISLLFELDAKAAETFGDNAQILV